MKQTLPLWLFLFTLLGFGNSMAQKNGQFQAVPPYLETLNFCEDLPVGPPLSPTQATVQDRWNNPIFVSPTSSNQRINPNGSLGGAEPAPLAPVDCANGFILTFEDIESSTGTGFDDPNLSPCGTGMTLGEERINTVCAVFDYISNVIDMGAVNTQIYFSLSQFDGFGPLATAGPLFDVGISPGTYQAGYLRDHIVNGVDPNPSAYDAIVNFDFGTRFLMGEPVDVFPCLDCPDGALDMYTIMLHEATHALGFFSWIDQNGTSKHSGLLAGPFSIMDNYMLNGAASDLLTGGGSFAGPLPDITNNVIEYYGPGNTQNDPVYSPGVWSGGSSLSHFDDTRSTFHHIMHNSTSGGDNRLYSMPEIEVLVDLGYTLEPGVYTGPPADNNYVIGVNDVGYSTTPGTTICIPALDNDIDPDGDPISYGMCGSGCTAIPSDVTLMLGEGTATIVGSDICFTPEDWYGGPAIIKYCPTDGKYNSSLVNTDNCTFIYIDVEGPCPGDPCNLVCNGTFENRADNCVTSFNFSTLNACPNPFIANVCRTSGTADVIVRGCPWMSLPTNQFDIPNNHAAGLSPLPGTEVWDISDPDNNTYIAMIHDGISPYTEGIFMELNDPLTAGETYRVSFQVSSKTVIPWSDVVVNGKLQVGFTTSEPPVGPGNVNTDMDWYATSDSPFESEMTVTSKLKIEEGEWELITLEVTPTVLNLRYLIIEPSVIATGFFRNKILLDDVRVELAEPQIAIKKTVDNPNPLPGDVITYSIEISNLDETNAATDLTLQDLLPPGVTYVSSTFSDPPTEHNIATLPALATVNVTVTATVDLDAPLGVPITNCAYLTSGNSCMNTGEENCADIIIPATDVALTKTITSGPGPYEFGDIVTFEITAENLGDFGAFFIDIEDIMPPGLTYLSHSIVGPGVYSDPNFQIIILGAGNQSVLTLNTIVNSVASCGSMTNCVNLNSMIVPDLVLSNNSSCVDFDVIPVGGISASFPIHPGGGNEERARGLYKPDVGLYVTGNFDDEIDFGIGAMTSLGDQQAYVVKYGGCDIEWQHAVGSVGADDYGIGVEAHPVTGRLYASGNAGAPFLYNTVNIPTSGTYVVELSPVDGTALWGHSIPNTEVYDIAVDPNNGRVAVTGWAWGSFNFAGDPYTPADADIFVAVYDRDGNELWADLYGSPGQKDYGHAVAFNGIGYLYVAGMVAGPPSAPFGGLTPAYAGGTSDGFIGYYNPGGNRINGKFFATPGEDIINDIDIDPAGNRVFIAGINGGTMMVGGGPIITSFGGRDAFAARLFGNLNGVWARDWGSVAPNDYAESIVYKNNRIYVGGGFRGTANFPGFPNPTMTCMAGLDVFMCTMAANSGNPRNNIQSNNVGTTWNHCWDIVADDNRYGYLAGDFFASTVFGASTLTSTDAEDDAFVARGYGEAGGTFAKTSSADGAELLAPVASLLTVFPNPTTGQLTLAQVEGSSERVRLTLIDLQGRVEVLEEAADFTNGNIRLDLSHKAQGVYFLKIESDGHTQTEKVILLGE